ncbi:LysR family transcriptional regulator [Lapillicoccus sp.]|uniref:LysR family transcriptional regulator n=1 Tax=Lapillicoccus sp. TaxID=1909287 RepID=UPI0039837C05
MGGSGSRATSHRLSSQSDTDAAVSLHVASLRKELGDQLFVRTSSGLAFTPGGLRLATHAVEMLGLADRPIQEGPGSTSPTSSRPST